MKKLMAITTGLWNPASNFRVRSLVSYLAKLGTSCDEFIPYIDAYPPKNHLLRPIWLLAALVSRLPTVMASRSYDAVLFQRELISTLSTLEWAFKGPRILDVDDAIHLSQRGKSVERIATLCDLIICGNTYLADQFSNWNSNVRVVPTGIDVYRYKPRVELLDTPLTIGWIGTSSNFPYLIGIEKALQKVLRARPNISLKIVSDKPPSFQHIPPDKCQFEKWSYTRDVEMIGSFSVGIMPLFDNDWAKGKCSFKLLQYYACGIPAVVSPVGMNVDVLGKARAGLAASTEDEWVDNLIDLLDNPLERKIRGKAGRKLVENEFSLSKVASELNNCIEEVLTE